MKSASQKQNTIFLPSICSDYGRFTGITNFQVQNGTILLGLHGKSAQFIRIQNGKQTNIKLPIDDVDRIAYVHLDWSAQHALISTIKGENFYIYMKNPTQPKLLRKLKGVIISCIAWNLEVTRDNETGFIVLGTKKGSLIETNITSAGQMNYLKVLTNSMVQTKDDDKEYPIMDMTMHICSEADEPKRYLLMVCTIGRIYSFSGDINMEAINQSQQQQPVVGTVWSTVMLEPNQAVLQPIFDKKASLKFIAAEKESLPSALAVYPVSANEPPKRFAWLNADGLNIGSIDCNHLRNGRGNSSDATSILSVDFFFKHSMTEGRFDYPLDIALTEFHVLQLYTNRFTAYSTLDKSMVYEDFFHKFSTKLVGMGRDGFSQLVWVFTESQLLKYQPHDENRNVWRIYLAKKDFLNARKIAGKMTDPNPLQTVIRYEAENFIDEKNYVAAAELLALSADTFESLVLKFLRPAKSSRNGLKRFLELKLNQLISNASPQSNEEKIRRDLLVLWLLEIQLGELAELRKQTMNTRGVMPSLSEKMTDSGSAGYATPEPDALTRLLRKPDDIKKIREELYCFFNRAPVFECISENRDVIYGLCSAHVDFETQMHLAQKLKDSEMIIRILLHQKQFFEALDVLNSQHCEPQLFYRYSPELISEIPSELVDSFLKKEKLINPVLLLPTFYKFLDPTVKRHPKELAATFQYFDRILLCASIQQIDQKILNFIIQLYANFRPNALLDCFKRIIQRFRLDPMNPAHCFNLVLPFDIEQALRICIEKGLKKCSVFLYALENRYDDAIKLALTEDLELAKQYALELNQKFQRYSSAANQISIDMHADEASKDKILEAHNSLNPFDDSKENETDNLFDNLLDTSFDLMLLQKLGEMKKRVWIEIVKHVVLRAIGKKEIQDSLILLRDSQGTIDIRDILQFYPDLTTIEHFKEPICECLREHSQEIQAIQKETVEVSKMASELRADIEHANSNHMVVKSSDRCAKCREVLLTRSFLAFCCRHFFHRDCLEKHMLNVIFSSEERLEYHNALAEQRALKRQREVATASLTKRKDPNPSAINKKRAPMNDILRLLADDCPFCGHRAIEAISQPFYSMEEYEAELKLWI